MSIYRTDGGVIDHAVKRLIKQYKFNGSKKEARKLLQACRKIADKSIDEVIISSEKINVSKGQLERWNIPDGKLIAIINNEKVITVIDRRR